ncbi:phlebovirus glycoprotein g2 domain-containing protein [Ditylenchus destructor]|uniref:Phlebovirus glycoprotein g2 domain-containing protein n=1 Tax=Ditylenchus destructor TaxID=166010 RepID=A0AAD4N5B2_9BILA|nr:phlebovirus glycoprotein g2 domain-containing protein [Ditylenchus destructor]
MNSAVYKIRIHLEDGKEQEVMLNGTQKITTGLKTTSVTNETKREWIQKLANLKSSTKEPDILIGMSDFWEFVDRVEQISLPQSGAKIHMIHTKIGPLICGQTQAKLMRNSINSSVIVCPISVKDEEVRQFWNLESIGVYDNPEDKDNRIPWNVGEDKLIVKFMPKQIFEQKRPTKRSVLQDLAGTFDPLGLVTPATLPAKLFFQKLWNMSDKKELSVNEQWWHGPHWLSQNEENWPQILEVKPPEEPEITVTETLSCALNSEEPIMKAERFSSWTRMQRAMAYALRYLARRATTTGFLQNFRNEGPLTAEEIKSAKLILLKNHQKSSEITQEKFKNWKLYEENGLLKIQSRLANSELSDEAKNPIFLYPKARITELIIMKCHAEVHHAGVEATVTRFLREYWTLHARQEVRSALRTCAVCKIIRGKPFALPRMPPLPRERTEKSPIDFLAPFKTITLEGPNPEEGEDWLPKRLTRDKVLEVWRNTTDRLGKFWDRWKNEYLVLLRDKLHAEHKGTRWQHYREPKLNEIVLVEEDYLPRNMWKLGKIVELKDSSGAVRAAKVLMPNKNVLTRPINRLYTLEIEGKDEKSTKETKNPEEEKRKTYNLRDRNRIKKTAFYTIISLVMCLAVAQAAPTAMKCNDCQMKCSNRGVKLILPKYIDKAEICCEEQDCYPYQGKEEITVTLSDSALINEYTCEAKLWQKTEVKEKLRIKCAAKNECDLINCYVCSKRLQNPECRPNVTTIIYGVGITVAFCVLYSLMKIVWELISKMFYCLRFACCLCQVMYTLCNRKKQKSHTANKEEKEGLLGTSEEEKGSSCVEKGPKPQKSYFGFRFIRSSRNSLSGGKMAVAILAILYLMAGYTEGCAEIISLKAREEKCVKNQNGTICSLNEVTELTLLPTGQEACLLISDVKGEPMGTLKLKLDGIRIKCMPSIQSITRSYVAKIYGNHRCPRMGSCMNDYCSTVELNTQVEELKDYENYPGNNFCVDSCTTYDCETWCALPTPSCVFYRVYAMPLSDTIYEVFTCPDWVYEVKLDLKMEVNRTEETSEIIAAEGITTRWKEISVSPVAITRPPAPLFGQHFVSDGINAAMVTEFTTDLSCVNYTAANELKCSLNPKACQNCRDNSQKINCHCRDSNIEEIMENPSSRLPLEVGRYEMKNEGKEVFAESRHTPVQLVVKLEGLSLATLNHENTCKIKPLEITGCYRCDSGAKLTYECETDFGEALAIVRCAEASFTQTCDNSSKTYTASLHFNTAEVKTMCNVTCPKETTQFELEAVLQYVPKSVQMLSETQSKNNEEIGLFTCDICDIDLRHAMNFLFAWDRILIVVLVISVSSVILMLCLKYNPMIRIMRKGYRLLAIFAIMPLLGLQSMVLAHPVNGGNAIHQNDSLGTSIFPYNDVTQPKASFIPAVPDLLSTLQHIVMSKASKIRKLEAQLAALREEADSDSSDSSITSGNAPVDSRNFTVSDFVIDEAREDNGKRGKKRAHELKCSRCANFGHTSRSKRCPLNSAEKNRAEKPTRPLPPGKRPPGFPNEEEEEEIAVAALIENEEIVKTPCYEEAAENIPVGESNPIEKTLPTEKIEEQAFCEKSEEKAEENEKKRSEDSGEEKGEKRSGEEIVNTQKIEKNSAACREKVEKIDCVKEKSTEERDEMTAVEKREEKKMSKAENNEKAEPGKTPTRSGNESYDSEQKKFGESRGLSKSGDKTEREKSHQKSPKETEKTKESEKKKAALEAYHIPKLTSSWKERIKRSVESLPRNELFPQRNIPEDEEIRSFIKEEIERAVSREIDTSLGILKMELKQEMRKSRNDLADVLEACASSLRKKRDSSPGVHVSGTGRKRSPKRSSRPEYR